jgi:hypothetical protein
MKMTRAVYAVILSGLVAACSCSTSGFQYRPAEVTSFRHDVFDRLLKKYVSAQGKVDYDAWHKNADDRRALQEYVNLIGNASPESHPRLFPDRDAQLAYWVNAYNALVIEGVLSHYPVKSVNDIKPGITVKQGQGFFYNLKFKVGGRTINLLDLEQQVLLEQYKDPRIHFAINCASGSCPPLKPEAFKGPEQLDALARAFINDEKNVYVSHDKKTIYVSKIFEWYADDFGDVRAFLKKYSTRPLPDEYALRYLDYDWNLNER